jgi:hypothetical protein
VDSWVRYSHISLRRKPVAKQSRENYQQGSSADPRYNLSFIVQASVKAGSPIIGVGIHYRLHGKFGAQGKGLRCNY